ncbi:MAG: hypothetical protein WKG07_26975 [Hymenobacter sp.]
MVARHPGRGGGHRRVGNIAPYDVRGVGGHSPPTPIINANNQRKRSRVDIPKL